MVADLSSRGSQETAQSIKEFGGRALAVECDVTRTEHVTAALDKAVEEFGHLDFAFNNAGAEQLVTPVKAPTGHPVEAAGTLSHELVVAHPPCADAGVASNESPARIAMASTTLSASSRRRSGRRS